MQDSTFLNEIAEAFRAERERAERALAQVDETAFFERLGPQCLAVQVKHIGGNLRSRWRDFLTTDGEKPDRQRDTEFVVDGDTRASIEAQWNEGWRTVLATLKGLRAEDLARTVKIRGEPHDVPKALIRGLTHVTYHTGQIVLLARHQAGDRWQSLSIPLGQSETRNDEMRAQHGSF